MPRTVKTYAEEQSERLAAERDSAFRATHVYSPTGWDRFDPRGGDGLTPGEPVQLLKEHTKVLHQGMPPQAKKMFNVVRNADNQTQHVSRDSLGQASRALVQGVFRDRRPDAAA